MPNMLKLVGNSIQLNRNLSSGDDGVLGPFTIQATQNGMSAAANFNLTVAGAAGPVPLPSPYPIQPGFTGISSASQITGPGNYQLMNDVQSFTTFRSDITVDGGGHSVAGNLGMNGTNVVIKNFHVNGGLALSGDNMTFTNNWVVGTIQNSIFSSNVTVSNNLFDEVNPSTDDSLTAEADAVPVLSNLQILNNIFQNAGDAGFEGVGGWTQSLIQNNRFNHLGYTAMGGWWNPLHTDPSGFHMTFCTFRNNIADAATVPRLYVFNGGSHGVADSDAAATAMWGGDGSDGNIINNNTFSGNLRK